MRRSAGRELERRAGGPSHRRPRVRRAFPWGAFGWSALVVACVTLVAVALMPVWLPDDSRTTRFGARLPSMEPGGPVPGVVDDGPRFFTVVRKQDGRWVFRTPDGRPFYSLGVNAVRVADEVERGSGRCPYCDVVATRYADTVSWAATTGERLEAWGFNTLGAWSDADAFAGDFVYAPLLDVGGSWQPGAAVRDWFDPAFEAHAREVAQARAQPRANDPNLLGWFLDDDLRWGPDTASPATLLDQFLALPEGTPGRAAAEARRGDPAGFVTDAAKRYFKVAVEALRASDPHHLVLGVRASSVATPPEVVRVAGEFVDVFSVDAYRLTPDAAAEAARAAGGTAVPPEPDLKAFHELSGRPVLVAEFASRAADAGVPNTVPAGHPVEATQEDRGTRYAEAARAWFDATWVVGHHWYRYVDSPAGGRAVPDDGQDSNFGLVSAADLPWEPLVRRMAEVNAEAPHRR